MKKMFLMTFMLVLTGTCVFAAPQMQVVNSNSALQDYYTKMKTCTPAKASGMEIYGKSGSMCEFKDGPFRCKVPMSVAQRFAAESLKGLGKSGTNKFVDDVINNPKYCSFSR